MVSVYVLGLLGATDTECVWGPGCDLSLRIFLYGRWTSGLSQGPLVVVAGESRRTRFRP